MLETQIQRAMRSKHILFFRYDGYLRAVEPHVLGIHGGVRQFLGFQVGGSSRSGGIPDWRRFDLVKIVDLHAANDSFPGRRPTPSGRHSHWDHIIEIVG